MHGGPSRLGGTFPTTLPLGAPRNINAPGEFSKDCAIYV